MPRLSFRVEMERPAKNTALLRLSGRLAGPAAGRTLSTMAGDLPDTVHRLILDLGAVEYMDGVGVGSVAQLCCSARSAGHQLVITGMNPRVRSIMDAAGFLSQMDQAATVAEALAPTSARAGAGTIHHAD